MKTNTFLLKVILIQIVLIAGAMLSAQARKDFVVTLVPLTGIKDSFLLQCSVEEHTAQRNASSMFTTRLPSLPVKVGKWEEAIYVLSNRKMPMQKVRLIDRTTFTYPIEGISRKVLLTKEPDYPGEYRLQLFWYEGKMTRNMEITSFRICTDVILKQGIPVKIGSIELTK